MQREPDTVGAFLDEVRKARGADARLDRLTDEVDRRLAGLGEFEPVARRVVEMMAFTLQGSLLVRHSAPATVADRGRRPGGVLELSAEDSIAHSVTMEMRARPARSFLARRL